MVKIFFAGTEAWCKVMNGTNANVLLNYYYIKDGGKKDINFKTEFDFKEVFLDSGAFTAWTNGVKIDIVEYCEFVKKFPCDYYSVLDVIGDDKATFENQKKMEELGTHPVPCFHVGDDWKYLEHYCEKYDFVSLGGMVGKSTKDLKQWLDKVFLQFPNQKFHGFGMTRQKLILRYPFYSVDSTSHIKTYMVKKIYSAEFDKFLYLGSDKSVCKLLLSNPSNKKWIDKLTSWGIDLENLYTNYKEILKANVYGYKEYEDMDIKPDINKQKTLF